MSISIDNAKDKLKQALSTTNFSYEDLRETLKTFIEGGENVNMSNIEKNFKKLNFAKEQFSKDLKEKEEMRIQPENTENLGSRDAYDCEEEIVKIKDMESISVKARFLAALGYKSCFNDLQEIFASAITFLSKSKFGESHSNLKYIAKVQTLSGFYSVFSINIDVESVLPLITSQSEMSFIVRSPDESWSRLPVVTPDLIESSQHSSVLSLRLTGKLESSVCNLPLFSGNESHLLACRLQQLIFKGFVCPKNLITEDDSGLSMNEDETIVASETLEDFTHYYKITKKVDADEESEKQPQLNEVNVNDWMKVNEFISEALRQNCQDKLFVFENLKRQGLSFCSYLGGKCGVQHFYFGWLKSLSKPLIDETFLGVVKETSPDTNVIEQDKYAAIISQDVNEKEDVEEINEGENILEEE